MTMRYSRKDLEALVRAERLEVTQQLLVLRREGNVLAKKIAAAEQRLEELDRADTLLDGM